MRAGIGRLAGADEQHLLDVALGERALATGDLDTVARCCELDAARIDRNALEAETSAIVSTIAMIVRRERCERPERRDAA